MAKLSSLPKDAKEAYEAEDRRFDMYSRHTQEYFKKGPLTGARALKALGTLTNAQIAAKLGGALSEDEAAAADKETQCTARVGGSIFTQDGHAEFGSFQDISWSACSLDRVGRHALPLHSHRD